MEDIGRTVNGPGKFYNINTPEEYRKIIPEKIKEKAQQTPVVSFVAYSGTGKTTFLEKLIPKLKAYGLKIAIVKHDGHRFDIDHEGKDSDRFTKAGADVTGLISSEKAVLMDNRTVDPDRGIQARTVAEDYAAPERKRETDAVTTGRMSGSDQ